MASAGSNLSCLSSLKDEVGPVYIQPHYKESYRLAIYALLCGGQEAYEEFLRAEQLSHLLSEEEILFILRNAELPDVDASEGRQLPDELSPSTYFPTESDEQVPDLDLGWPEVTEEDVDTSISLLFHPPRQNTPTIKEVVRRQIQEAKQVVAIAMDVFTDVDIFKELISATLRGVVVYILLDHSQFPSFHAMSQRVGVNIQDLKNIRVRTVRGQQYQCQSGVKFHGGLEQKFILVDCQTVLYGTYSYKWSFEKIHLSMVLVITGQLVGSYDEEFRRLYANSTIPLVLSGDRFVQYPGDPMFLHSPNSSQLSLHQIHMNPRVMHSVRGAQEDRLNHPAMTRGLSVQDRLHQSHCPDMNLARGHSYAGDLQKLNSKTRPRMGTKDFGVPPERTGPNMRITGDPMLPNRFSQQYMKHRTLYGADQNLIPFNSETSLHRWKIDAYLNDSNAFLDASCDPISPVISPYSSHTGLNEHQSQLIHSRSRDIKARLEEQRLKRLSLQEYNNPRQSQESLRSMYATLERQRFMPPVRGLDIRQSLVDLDPNTPEGSLEAANHKDVEEGNNLTAGNRSASYYDVQSGPDRKTRQMHDWHEPLSRTSSAADLNVKLNEPPFKLSHLPPSGLRTMESLIEIPEERECSNTHNNSTDSFLFIDGCEERDKHTNQWGNADKSSIPAEPQHQDAAKGSSTSKSAPRDVKTSLPNETETVAVILNPPPSSEAKSGLTEKQQEEPARQRRNSTRQKAHPTLPKDEKKIPKKEEKSLQRKTSLRSQNSSESNQTLRTDSRPISPDSVSRKKTSTGGPPEREKHKSPFHSHRLSVQRSSKRKTQPAVDERGSRNTLDDERLTAYQTRSEQAYHRYEYMLSTKNTHHSDRERKSSLSRRESVQPTHHTQSGADNKLGRFMQRVGNLIGKNK